MKKFLLAVFLVVFFASNHVWAKTDVALVRQIVFSGFVLSNKQSLDKIVKPYRNKKLSHEQIAGIIEEIKSVYLQAGYSGLVSIDYQLKKMKLTIKITLKQ